MKIKNLLIAVIAIVLSASNAYGIEKWQRLSAPVMSTWAENLDPDNVWPEYPRPSMIRNDWMNLNGRWEYFKRANVTDYSHETNLNNFTKEILVPFPVESALSGIMDQKYFENSRSTFMYRRTFTVPENFAGKKVILHFGGVDWKCTVYINGKEVGTHAGGHDPFFFDITSALAASGEQEIQVAVTDPTNDGGQPHGKQNLNPAGIWYTPVSGIWQTVWLEPVGPTHLERYEVNPDIDNGTITIKPIAQSETATAKLTVKDDDNVIATATDVPVNTSCTINIPNAKLWSPDAPNLYDLVIEIYEGTTKTDEALGYFGMRKFSRGMALGHPCILLNNKPLYLYGPLDQGWWPDGLYTAPSYEALIYDLQVMKDFGMNMVRKHIKTEPDVWYTWCDRNGLVVWQDMVNGGGSGGLIGNKEFVQQTFYKESVNVVNAFKQHPSIGAWIPYNEGWGQDAASGSKHTSRGVKAVRNADDDQYRLINSVTGWTDFGLGDFVDVHSYPAPGASNNPGNERIVSCGEFGGITFEIKDHLWAGSQQVYTAVDNAEAYTNLYNEYTERLQQLQASHGLWSSVYTQITDVEQEVNGILTYDRKVLKVSEEQKKSMKAKIEQTINFRYTGNYQLIEPAADTNSNIEWSYTTTTPASNWYAPDFDCSSWTKGKGGFGKDAGRINTRWSTSDIYIRRNFTLPSDMTQEQINAMRLWIFNDEDCEVYINGVLAFKITGYVNNYRYADISDAAKQTLKAGEESTIAIHCHQTGGGQFIDAGLRIPEYIANEDLEVTEMPAPQTLPELTTNAEKAYLMAYYKSSDEKLYLAYSEDGAEWKSLNGDRAVFNAYDNSIRLRDPFIKAVTIDGKTTYHLLHTKGMDNTSFYHWQSTDLVTWTDVNGGQNGEIQVVDGKDGRPSSTNAWAPEFIYDEESNEYVVYWTSNIDGKNQFLFMTTTDWKTFSNPISLFAPRFSATDLHMLKIDGTYYAFYYDSSNGSRVHMATTDNIKNIIGRSKLLNSERLFATEYPQVLAPQVYPSINGDGYFLSVDYLNSDNLSILSCSDIAQKKWYQLGDELFKLPSQVSGASVIVVNKSDLEALFKAYGSERYMIVPTAEIEPQEWRYNTGTVGTAWYSPKYNDKSWAVGLSGFGAGTPPNTYITTNWNSKNIVIRRNLDLTGCTQEQMNAISGRIYHDEDCFVYINGVLAFSENGYLQDYKDITFRDGVFSTLTPDNNNIIAVKCTDANGGRYIDFGVYGIRPTATGIDNVVADKTENQPITYNCGNESLILPTCNDKDTLSVFDISGRQLMQITPNDEIVSVNHLPQGIYIATYGNFRGKFIK